MPRAQSFARAGWPRAARAASCASVAALLALGLAACERSRPAPSEAPPASVATASAAPALDAKAVCTELCQRSTRCSVEAVERLGKSGAADAALVASVRAEAPAVEARCAEGCAADARGDDPALRAARACLPAPACSAFESCVQAL